jgi:nucleoid-associated protein YgaU
VVRVEPTGEAVLAGRAAAGSDVAVLDGAALLGNVLADPQGQWAYVVETPLAPGSHELGLRSRLADGRVIESADVVVVNVPQPQIAAAPQGTAEQAASAAGAKLSPEAGTAAPAQPLAVLMPRSGEGPSQVLQQTATRTEGLGEGTLVLETVDYDESSAVIGGRAEPGARLLVYLDDALLGETTAEADGRWRLALDRPLTTGLHRLRVDQVDAQGKVLARVETPFSRAALVASLPNQTSVVVQPGNSLWRIARRVYGEGVRYSVIYAANREQIRDADLIYPGQIFVIPAEN